MFDRGQRRPLGQDILFGARGGGDGPAAAVQRLDDLGGRFERGQGFRVAALDVDARLAGRAAHEYLRPPVGQRLGHALVHRTQFRPRGAQGRIGRISVGQRLDQRLGAGCLAA